MFDQHYILDPTLVEEDHEEAFRTTVAELGTDTSEERHLLPGNLENIPPGLFLAAILASVDSSRLSGHDSVRFLEAQARLLSHQSAGYYAGISEVAHAHDPDGTGRNRHPVEFAAEEIQAALGKTRRSAELELQLAIDFCRRMPSVWDAMEKGNIDVARAKVFASELESLHPALVPEAVSRTLPEAPGLTTGQLRARLQRITLELDPRAAEDRRQAGVEDRRMVTESNPDHTASLLFHNVAAKEALLASRYVNAIAAKLKRRPGETKTMDQLRADIALDLLQGKSVDGAPPVPAPIMLLIDDLGGHVPGFGPVLPATVVDLLDDRDITLNVGDCTHETKSRRPTKAQAEHIRRRYPSCIFPGCRMPAVQCDLDHRVPVSENGPTTCENLAPLCRHHHVCKTNSRWRLRRNRDGSHTWISPLGHEYRSGRPP